MKLLMILFLLGLPGVARTSQLLDARQGTPSGNSSVILPPQSSSSSSQQEPAAPSLVATSTEVITTSSSLPKQERGPQGPDVTAPGPPPPEPPVPAVVTTSVDLPPPGDIPASPATTSTSVEVVSTATGTTILAPSSPTTGASAETSSAQLTTIVTKDSLLVGPSSLPTTLITSLTTSCSSSSTTPSEEPEETTTTTTTSNSEIIFSPTATDTMSSPTPTPSSTSSDTSSNGNSTLTIALSTVLSVAGVALIAVAAYLCTGSRRKRLPMFGIKRGITPIGDDEIATWKSNRSAEKVMDRYTTRPSHSQNPSTATSTRRAPSVIQYNHGGRSSFEPTSPRSFIAGGGKYSFDLPQQPPGAVLARAPNARSGLTDEAVPGDDPFLPSPKRHPSRLHKLPPSSPSLHGRAKGSRSSSLRSYAEAAWRDGQAEALSSSPSPRVSADAARRGHNRLYSNSSIPPPPRLSFGDNEQLTGLSPPPSRRNDSSTIGLAVG
ncbi:hypothetical protein F4804DRAFT_351099 [Jackrogersella minutella]|nr:hypothetical protein F4804DRAFT_351099 [Jackrogersella minutella]